MGLTDRRKTPNTLVDSRKTWKNLTVSRKQGKKGVNRKRNCSLDLLMVALLISRLLDSVRTLSQAPFSFDLDLDSISAALPGN